MKLTANRLTLLRILLLPLPCALLYGGPTAKLTALGVASLLGLTDYFDGRLARRQGVTRLGALLDPIADKIMVAAVILVLAAQGVLNGPYVGDMHVVAGLIILMREIAVSGLREFLGPLQVSVPVSKLAKWKTTFQMVSLGALILGEGLPRWTMMIGAVDANIPHTVGLVTLWAAAVLTVITGWDYLRAGLKHMD